MRRIIECQARASEKEARKRQKREQLPRFRPQQAGELSSSGRNTLVSYVKVDQSMLEQKDAKCDRQTKEKGQKDSAEEQKKGNARQEDRHRTLRLRLGKKEEGKWTGRRKTNKKMNMRSP
jgi:hypothetical protein